MTNARNIAYPHRHNADGSIDSICITCFATIAQTKDEAALFELERNHFCNRSFLADRESALGFALRRLKQTAENWLHSKSGQSSIANG